mgnify:CR=1 FL=1
MHVTLPCMVRRQSRYAILYIRTINMQYLTVVKVSRAPLGLYTHTNPYFHFYLLRLIPIVPYVNNDS